MEPSTVELLVGVNKPKVVTTSVDLMRKPATENGAVTVAITTCDECGASAGHTGKLKCPYPRSEAEVLLKVIHPVATAAAGIVCSRCKTGSAAKKCSNQLCKTCCTSFAAACKRHKHRGERATKREERAGYELRRDEKLE